MAGYLMRQGQPPQGWRNGLADSVDLMRTTRFKTAAGAGVVFVNRVAFGQRSGWLVQHAAYRSGGRKRRGPVHDAHAHGPGRLDGPGLGAGAGRPDGDLDTRG